MQILKDGDDKDAHMKRFGRTKIRRCRSQNIRGNFVQNLAIAIIYPVSFARAAEKKLDFNAAAADLLHVCDCSN